MCAAAAVLPAEESGRNARPLCRHSGWLARPAFRRLAAAPYLDRPRSRPTDARRDPADEDQARVAPQKRKQSGRSSTEKAPRESMTKEVEQLAKEHERCSKELQQAYCELNRRITEHDKCQRKQMGNVELTLHAIADAEGLVEKLRAAAEAAEENLSLARLRLREQVQADGSRPQQTQVTSRGSMTVPGRPKTRSRRKLPLKSATGEAIQDRAQQMEHYSEVHSREN